MPNAVNAHLTVRSKCDELCSIRCFVADAAKQAGFSDDDTERIVLAVDEACTNVIRHGYAADPSSTLSLHIDIQDDCFVVTIDDSGKQYDIRHHEVPNMHEYFQARRTGGLGIKLIKMLVDKIEYHRANDHNRLILTKHLPEANATTSSPSQVIIS
ncbi:MAG: ATP-binding protein [Chlorobiales bacterium]|nr:ATP-binding protein [Chlorobiales bacterium]